MIVKKWRPKNWEKIRSKILAVEENDIEETLCGEDRYCFQSFEDGADAMLKALMDRGLNLDE